MKTIREPRKNVVLLWRRPTPIQAIYRPMKYLLRSETEDGLLLYNVVTSEMVLLNDRERKVFESSPTEYHPDMDEMIARHFLVTADFAEEQSVRELREILKKLKPSKRISGFTILPTTACNARCYYCFENNYEHCTISNEMVPQIVDYMAIKCKGEPIEIGWFGGEPLVAHKRISQICEGLRAKGIKYGSTMVSNAYLFDEDLVKIAKEDWKLISVQITLDGTEEVYNETKAYINPKDNPYRRVLRNIGLLLDNGIAVNIRLNVTEKNYQDLSILIDELAKRFGGKKGFTCYSHTVYEGVGFDPVVYEDSKDVEHQTVALDAKLREKGLLGSLSRLPTLRMIQCMADSDSCRLIYPDGKIGKCENKSSEECIGDIFSDITDEKMHETYKVSDTPPGCVDCCMFPYCINLRVCPETGNCSKERQKWRETRYAFLMKEEYLRYKQNGSENNPDDDTLECES